MQVNAYLTVTGVLCAVLGGAHVLRLIYGWPVAVADRQIPLEFSWASGAISFGLVLWAIVLLRRRLK